MEKTEAIHTTHKPPPHLLKADEMAQVIGITTEKLLEFVEARQCPYWQVLDGPPLFAKTEVKNWALRNLYCYREGRDVEQHLIVVNPILAKVQEDKVPAELSCLNNLCKAPDMLSTRVSGVYFLCDAQKVLYVGQSVDVQSRIFQHRGEGKVPFESAYFLPLVKSSLNAIESAFIKTLIPPYNENGGRACASVEEAKRIVQGFSCSSTQK